VELREPEASEEILAMSGARKKSPRASVETRQRGLLGLPDSAGCHRRVTLGALAGRLPRRS
jgi:hypothetical protein